MSTPIKDLADGTILVRDNQNVIAFPSANRYISFFRRDKRFIVNKLDPDDYFVGELHPLPFTIYDIFKILMNLDVAGTSTILTNMTNADIGEIQLEKNSLGSAVRIKVSKDSWIHYDDSDFTAVMDVDPDSGNYPRIVFKNLPQILEIIANLYKERQ